MGKKGNKGSETIRGSSTLIDTASKEIELHQTAYAASSCFFRENSIIEKIEVIFSELEFISQV
jgi:hypothetical protein